MKIILFLLMLIVMLLILMLSMKILDMKNIKNIYFLEIECGMFSMMNKNSGSVYYIMFLIIFMLFDLELILFFILIEKSINYLFMMFIYLISISLIYEIFNSSLKWND